MITPLNWGLGHASRCVPIIRYLIQEGHEVIIGSSGDGLLFLEKVFPELTFIELPDYKIRYPFRSIFLNFISFFIPMLFAVWKEKRVVRKYIKQLAIDFLISDNRLGCYSPTIPCAYISHQLQFAFRVKGLSQIAARVHYYWYRRFDEIWVPDVPPPNNLSGKLSHPFKRCSVHYLGFLSQFSYQANPIKYQAMALLSGPEPQRSHLEKLVIDELSDLKGKFLLVRGLPGKVFPIESPTNVTVLPFLAGEELAEAISSAEIIICRSGYSSLMDLSILRKPALLIPTHGQAEQIYLAKYLEGSKHFIAQAQNNLNISQALKLLSGKEGPVFKERRNRMEEVLTSFLKTAKRNLL